MRNDITLDIGVVGLGTHGLNRAQTLVDFDQRVYGSDTSSEARRRFERRFDGAHVLVPKDWRGADVKIVRTSEPTDK